MRTRSKIVLIFVSFLFLLALSRLVYIQIARPFERFLAMQGRAANARPTIYDRQGKVLAKSVPSYRVHIKKSTPLDASNVQAVLKKLNVQTEKKFETEIQKRSVLVKRYLSEEQYASIKSLLGEDFLVEKVAYRLYPQGENLGNFLGFVGYDGKGLAGFEYSLDHSYPKQEDVYLTVDIALQKKIKAHLEASLEHHQARGGVVIIQDINSRELIVLEESPSYNPEDFQTRSPRLKASLALQTVFEPGSVMKLFFAAKAIDEQNINIFENRYLSEGKTVLPNGEVIRDHRIYGSISMVDTIKHSINSGIIQASAYMANDEFRRYLAQLSLNERPRITYPASSKGIIPEAGEWGLRTRATIPLGQGLSVNALQLLNAFSSLLDGGEYKIPVLTLSPKAESDFQYNIISSNSSTQLIQLLRFGTTPGSTGWRARPKGIDIIGKTGTAQVLDTDTGLYSTERYNSVFLGAWPADKPRYAILSLVLEPTANGHAGGIVAAPLFKKSLIELLKTLEKPPEYAIDNKSVDSSSPLTYYGEGSASMPALSGLSLRQALTLLAQELTYPLPEITIDGHGRVYRQKPKPGTARESIQSIHLELSLEP